MARPMTVPAPLFDRDALRRRTGAGDGGFLKAEMIAGLQDRLSFIARRFDTVVDLGSHDGALGRALAPPRLISIDPCAALLRQARGLRLAADLDRPPLADGCADLIVSAGRLHWVDDLPGTLIACHRLLRPDGLFLAAFPGGHTLQELRLCLIEAESEARGGAERRIGPFVDVRDGGALLQRAGFAMPVADIERLTVRYRNPATLLDDLRAMAETARYAEPGRRPLTRSILADALARYAARHNDGDGLALATFDILYLCGWARAEGQPQPLPRGTARTSLADALKKRDVERQD